MRSDTELKTKAVRAMVIASAMVSSPQQQIAHAIDIFNKEVSHENRSGIANPAKFILETYKHFEETGMVARTPPLSVRRRKVQQDAEMQEMPDDDPNRRGTKRKRDPSHDNQRTSPTCTTLSISAPPVPFPRTSPLVFTSTEPAPRRTRRTRGSTRTRRAPSVNRSVPLVRQDSSADPCTQQLSKRVRVR